MIMLYLEGLFKLKEYMWPDKTLKVALGISQQVLKHNQHAEIKQFFKEGIKQNNVPLLFG